MPGVVTVTSFQGTNPILDMAGLVITLVSKNMEEKLVLGLFVYLELYNMTDRNYNDGD